MPAHRSLVLVAPLFLFACSEQGFTSTAGLHDADAPAINVTPPLVEYGTLSQNAEPLVKTFTIQSVGGADLHVSDIQILGDSESFTILSDVTEFVLPPGSNQEVPVAFLPMGSYDQMGQVVVNSDDPARPQSLVELLGAGAVPELQIDPDPVDFGATWIGCDAELDVYLSNVGSDELVISDLAYELGGEVVFTELRGLTLPLTLAPGEEAQVLLGFEPSEVRSYEGELVVTSNEPLGERRGGILGDGAYQSEWVDRWELPMDPPSDIIFMVDQSGSMDDDQSRLANNFSTFISSLATYTDDWQIMVVNDDNGCTNSGILTRTTAGYESIFRSAVSSGGGSYTEALLTVGATAVEKTDAGECNAGFLRTDAMLHMIYVSDEPEQSPGSWSTYVNQVIAKKGAESNVRMSAIAGPTTGGSCADPGTGYAEAVAATGGVFLSICGDWATPENLAALAEASVFQDTYELTRTPFPETIEVFVNGALRGGGWTYDATSNTVVFSTNVPTEGDQIEITYAGVSVCD